MGVIIGCGNRTNAGIDIVTLDHIHKLGSTIALTNIYQ
jgi:hypothetical protein